MRLSFLVSFRNFANQFSIKYLPHLPLSFHPCGKVSRSLFLWSYNFKFGSASVFLGHSSAFLEGTTVHWGGDRTNRVSLYLWNCSRLKKLLNPFSLLACFCLLLFMCDFFSHQLKLLVFFSLKGITPYHFFKQQCL